ncbi:hypothetical protein [Oleiharenicola lentus]|uniref:hypothetical protein n=1 Tax=Oleiharenicola lentus TaxID=2508720 RepID=UPI003F66F42A
MAATETKKPFSDELLARAVQEKAPRWKGTPGQRYREMPETFALHLTALAAHVEPDRKIAGTTLAASTAEKILSFLRSNGPDADGFTREPEAYGGLGGWSHNAAAQTLLLAKRTPAIWGKFTADDRHRADLVMRALAVAGHFGFDDENDYPVLLDGVSISYKSWNPNITEGYVDILVAASLYFGADELNAFFATFDFDRFVGELKAANFLNIVRGWTHTPAIRELLMKGGQFTAPGGPPPLKFGGTIGYGAGVRRPFTYRGWPLSAPWEIYRLQANVMFSKTVRTQITINGENRSRLLQHQTKAVLSPWEGRMGMCYEFETTDWDGLRTSLTYAYEGVMVHLGTAATLRVLGEWRDDAAGRDIERRMAVGVADLIFKAKEGYRGWSQGRERLNWLEQDLQPMGSDYIFPLWSELFPPAPEPSVK